MDVTIAWKMTGTRPLLFHDGVLYGARYDQILKSTDGGATFAPFARLSLVDRPFGSLRRWSALVRRLLREGVYRMRVLSDGHMVFVVRKGIYTLRAGEAEARLTHSITRGSRPVSLACKPGGLVVFGEYFDNAERGPIRIFGSADSGQSWRIVYEFPAGSIRHVHGLAYDRWEDCFWICTGDYGDECKVLRASADFGDVEVVRQGGQFNRFYSVLITSEHLLMATDTPLDHNFIFRLEKRTGEWTRLQQIQNSTFYGCTVGEKVYFTTVAESSEMNDSKACHLWAGSIQGTNWLHVGAFPTDVLDRVASSVPGLPKALFQFPRIFFPEGDNPTDKLICYGTGIQGLDDTLFGIKP